MSEVGAIRKILRGVTAAWREGRLEVLEGLLAADVVYVQPGLEERLRGVPACIESYRQFLDAATVHDYREEEPSIDVSGDVAVATVPFAIDYEIESGRFRESGHDLIVLARRNGTWRVQWRTLIPGATPL